MADADVCGGNRKCIWEICGFPRMSPSVTGDRLLSLFVVLPYVVQPNIAIRVRVRVYATRVFSTERISLLPITVDKYVGTECNTNTFLSCSLH